MGMTRQIPAGAGGTVVLLVQGCGRGRYSGATVAVTGAAYGGMMQGMNAAETITNNHGHTLAVPIADLDATTDKKHSIAGTRHDHTIIDGGAAGDVEERRRGDSHVQRDQRAGVRHAQPRRDRGVHVSRSGAPGLLAHQGALAEQALDEVDGDLGGGIAHVERRVQLHHVQRGEPARVGDHPMHSCAWAVGRPASLTVCRRPA